jgi:hypothetical protein
MDLQLVCYLSDSADVGKYTHLCHAHSCHHITLGRREEGGKDYANPETHLLICAVLVYWQSKVILFARRCFDTKKV